MKIPFWKMHGAGNDFILVDDRGATFPVGQADWLATVGRRKTGVGCDGFILIQNSDSDELDFRMRFFNPDGGEVEMCGNGARCVARLAHDIGVAGETMTFGTVAGPIQATVGETVELGMTDPVDWRLQQTVTVDGDSIPYGFVNSGVPHVVIEVLDVSRTDVGGIGAAIRYHADFAPAGTNVNFIQKTGVSELLVRTYERGVEAETLACGTGVTASALVSVRNGLVEPPVRLQVASGDWLEVDFVLDGDSARAVKLSGPAVYVYTGELDFLG